MLVLKLSASDFPIPVAQMSGHDHAEVIIPPGESDACGRARPLG